MTLYVKKFGGTSVATPDLIRSVARYIADCKQQGEQIVVVVSAMGNETDELLELAGKVATRPPKRELDMLITAGERKTMALLCMALADYGVHAESFTGSQAGIISDAVHQDAKIVSLTADRLRDALDHGITPVVGGAQGVSDTREVTFLGRNGSDTSAVALGVVLGAHVVEKFSDVAGVFTADPRIEARARLLPRIDVTEMLELSASGSGVIASRAVEFARRNRVSLHVRSSFTREPGTWISEGEPQLEQPLVTGIAVDRSESKITFRHVADRPGVAAHLFEALADGEISVDMIIQNVSDLGVTDISFTVPTENLARAVDICRAVGRSEDCDVRWDRDIAKVSVVGAGMLSSSGTAGRIFRSFGDAGINIQMISTSPIRVTCVVEAARANEAVRELHSTFELDVENTADSTQS